MQMLKIFVFITLVFVVRSCTLPFVLYFNNKLNEPVQMIVQYKSSELRREWKTIRTGAVQMKRDVVNFRNTQRSSFRDSVVADSLGPLTESYLLPPRSMIVFTGRASFHYIEKITLTGHSYNKSIHNTDLQLSLTDNLAGKTVPLKYVYRFPGRYFFDIE